MVSQGCHHKSPQACWLKTAEIHSLPVQEDRCLRSVEVSARFRSHTASSEGEYAPPAPPFFQLLVTAGIPWCPQLVTASPQSLPLSSLSPISCVSVCPLPPFLRTRQSSLISCPSLPQFQLQSSYFQIRSQIRDIFGLCLQFLAQNSYNPWDFLSHRCVFCFS